MTRAQQFTNVFVNIGHVYEITFASFPVQFSLSVCLSLSLSLSLSLLFSFPREKREEMMIPDSILRIVSPYRACFISYQCDSFINANSGTRSSRRDRSAPMGARGSPARIALSEIFRDRPGIVRAHDPRTCMSHALPFARATARDAARDSRRRLFTREHRAPSPPTLRSSPCLARPSRVSRLAYTTLPV